MTGRSEASTAGSCRDRFPVSAASPGVVALLTLHSSTSPSSIHADLSTTSSPLRHAMLTFTAATSWGRTQGSETSCPTIPRTQSSSEDERDRKGRVQSSGEKTSSFT